MALETHRKALRSGLPWIVAALFLLALSVASAACIEPLTEGSALAVWVERAGTASGALGSGAMLLGALQLARAKTGGRSSPALLAFFPLWLVELVARLADLASPEREAWLAVRVIAASLAMLGFAQGMLWLFSRQGARPQLPPWRLARTLFAVFTLAVLVALAVARWRAPEAGLWPWIESLPAGPALAWLAFVLPWIALVHAVRRSVRWVARRQSVAEVLTG